MHPSLRLSTAVPGAAHKPDIIAARSNPRTTLWCFAGVLGFALPYFIWSKRANERKKKERYVEARGGAFAAMNEGEKTSI